MRPLKKFSQNFLTNPHYQKKIVEALNIEPQDVVLEIGPGQGALTQHLVQQPLSRCLVVEVDSRMVQTLEEQFGKRIEIIHDDILNIDLCQWTEQHRLKVVGNLPYHITSPILFHLLDHFSCLKRAVLMTQKEVARRICAQPGGKEYGILSVLTQTFAQTQYLFEIKKGNFFPVPAVDSAVLALTFFETVQGIENLELYRKIVRTAFNFRRKTLKNSLGRIFQEKVLNSLDQSFLKQRPEQLTVDAFKHIANVLNRVIQNETD